MKYPDRKGAFKVEARKQGIQTMTYILDGENKGDFKTPEQSVLLVAPESTKYENKPFLLKGELPVGCEEQETKANFSCALRLLSSAPWVGAPSFTSGVVHLAYSNNQTVPLSLIGLNLNELHVSRDKLIENGAAKTSSNKNASFLYQRNGKGYSKFADSNDLLELMKNDAFVSSFKRAISAMAPEWLTLAVSETNEYFDIQNIAGTIATDLEHCSGIPFVGATSLAYYRPAVIYKIRVAQNEVPLFAEGRTCFAIDVCKPGLFINFPKEQAAILKATLDVIRDMNDCCEVDLTVDSVGFVKDSETSHFFNGTIWNGLKLQKLSSFSYNAWLKGSLHWRMEIPKLLFLTFKMAGETFIKFRNVDLVSILNGS